MELEDKSAKNGKWIFQRRPNMALHLDGFKDQNFVLKAHFWESKNVKKKRGEEKKKRKKKKKKRKGMETTILA